MRIQFACLLLVLLSATELSEAVLSFREKHIDPIMKQWECDVKMAVINKENPNECKPINAFILADENKVNGVCDPNKSQSDDVKSEDHFRIINCHTNDKVSPCHYTADFFSKRFIVIKCKGNPPRPYHYVRSTDN